MFPCDVRNAYRLIVWGYHGDEQEASAAYVAINRKGAIVGLAPYVSPICAGAEGAHFVEGLESNGARFIICQHKDGSVTREGGTENEESVAIERLRSARASELENIARYHLQYKQERRVPVRIRYATHAFVSEMLLTAKEESDWMALRKGISMDDVTEDAPHTDEATE